MFVFFYSCIIIYQNIRTGGSLKSTSPRSSAKRLFLSVVHETTKHWSPRGNQWKVIKEPWFDLISARHKQNISVSEKTVLPSLIIDFVQRKQREPGDWVHATLQPFHGIHTRSRWLHSPFPCPSYASESQRQMDFFFFCTHLIKEKIRREVGAVTLQKPPSLEGNTFGIQVERIHNLSSWQL